MDYDESEQTKFQMGVDLVSHMWHAGRKNIARTHSFFKLTFGILCVSSAIYMIGFVSPHWVVDDFDVHRDDVVDAAISNISVAGNSSNSTGADDNDNRHKPHGGVWEKCTVKGGKETCTVFVRDLDSVVAMLGCVGAALLVGACCWSGFVCVRKPRTSRYITTAIAAIIGGVFGLVCIFMFVGLQGRQSYSWGFALALAGSVLGLSAAAFTLLGIGKAMAAGLLPSGSEATLDNNANVIPEIVVTKATPRKRRTREKQQKSARKHRTSTRTMALSGAQALSVADRRESAVTLDMICPLPESKPKERKGRGSIAKSFSKSKLARRDTSDPQSFTAQLRRKSTPSSGKRQEVDFSRMDVFQPLIHFPSPQPPPELFLKSVDSADVGPNSKRRRSELRFDAEVYCHHLHNIDHSPARKPEKSDRRPRKFYEISASQTADSSRNIASTYPDSAGSADEQESLQVVPTCVLFRTPETRRRSEVFYTPEIHRTPSVRRTPYVKYGQRVLGQLQLPLSLQNVSPDGTVEEDDIHYVVYRADTAHRHHGNSFQSFKPSGEYEERMDLFS